MTSKPSTTPAAATTPSVGSRDKTVAWYHPTLGNLPPQTRDLLKTYSQIPESEMETHIYKIRDEAWEVWPYPCIGQFRFLTLALPYTPSYRAIITRLQAPNAKFLDLGCCFGQDLRALAADGVPGERLVGVELHGEFHDLGHKLFRDERTLGAMLVAADVFDVLSEGGAPALRPLIAAVDVLQASAFLHLFTWERQVDAGVAIIKLMKDEPGVMVVGTQVGSKKPGLYEQGRMYLHDVGSFEKLWADIGERTGSQWKVEAVLVQDPRKPWDDGAVGKLNFEIIKVV